MGKKDINLTHFLWELTVWKGAKAGDGESPKVNLKKDFVKEMVLASCLVVVRGVSIGRTQEGPRESLGCQEGSR